MIKSPPKTDGREKTGPHKPRDVRHVATGPRHRETRPTSDSGDYTGRWSSHFSRRNSLKLSPQDLLQKVWNGTNGTISNAVGQRLWTTLIQIRLWDVLPVVRTHHWESTDCAGARSY